MYGMIGPLLGVIHKPLGQLRGGVRQMTIYYISKPYLVKVATKWGGGSKIAKNFTMWFMDDPLIQRGHPRRF